MAEKSTFHSKTAHSLAQTRRNLGSSAKWFVYQNRLTEHKAQPLWRCSLLGINRHYQTNNHIRF